MIGSTNPLLARLTRQARGPAVWIILAASLVIAILGAVVQVVLWEGLGFVAGVPIGLMLLLLPTFVASHAGRMVARDAATRDYQLMRLTALPAARIVSGYVLAALHRFRVWLGLGFGLLPAVAIAYWQVLDMFSYNSDGGPQPTDADIAYAALVWAAMGYGMLLANLLAAALGVWLGLRTRKPEQASALGGGFIFVMSFAFLCAVMVFGGPAYGQSARVQATQAALIAGMALLPLLIGFGVMWLARRAV